MRTPANTHRPTQPASDALAIWERAAKENKPVGLDSHGDIAMLFGASHDSFRGQASHRQAAKDAILSKMRSEMSQRGSWNGSAIQNVMASQLPSLDSFIKDDQASNLRSEWNKLRNTTEASLALPPDVLANRIAVAERIAPFLPPGLGVSLHDEGLSWLNHTFSDKQQQHILDGLSSLARDAVDPALHLDPQMLKDLNRDTYDIVLPDGMSPLNETNEHQQFHQQIDTHAELTPKARQILRRLHAFCGGDRNMMTSLSKLINQKSVLKLIAANQAELRPASGTEIHIHANSKKFNSLSLYRLHRTNEGAVSLTVSHMKKGSALLDDQMQTLCRLKPGQQSEIANERNFNFRCSTEISMAEKNLTQKEITPSYVRLASVDHVLDVDWADSL
jgi:hypothetical protein